MTIARRFVLTGRVQGVGLRWFVMDAAAVEGIAGWVHNAPDGTVEIVAEGESEAMVRFERAVRQGPPRARVDDVATELLDPTGRFLGFSARS